MNAVLAKAYERLHHFSMRYFGAFIEAGSGKPVGLVPYSHPGRKEVRDIVDIALVLRAEVNALTTCLIKAKVFTIDEFQVQLLEEVNFLIKAKEKQLGCESTNLGLLFKTPGPNDPKDN